MINLDDSRQACLHSKGWEYTGGGIWEHPEIFFENSSTLRKEWTLHEAYTWEKYGVWDCRNR